MWETSTEVAVEASTSPSSSSNSSSSASPPASNNGLNHHRSIEKCAFKKNHARVIVLLCALHIPILFPAWQNFFIITSVAKNFQQIYIFFAHFDCQYKIYTYAHFSCLRRRKPSRSQFPGLVKKSHMGSLASIVNPRTYHRSSSVSAAGSASLNARPRSLHLPVTQTLSASSMVSPVLSVATRAINNNHLQCVEAGSSLPYPPLIFPAAEFAPGNHVLQGRSSASNNAKGEHIFST